MGRRHAEKQVRRPAMCNIKFNSRGKGIKNEYCKKIYFKFIITIV